MCDGWIKGQHIELSLHSTLTFLSAVCRCVFELCKIDAYLTFMFYEAQEQHL